ncbi:MAG: glycoside hydrolase family 65 protein [Verrucomicrobia bacterium]|nr:glycoside hydrolase family 65 protein [Verrucomicrobiota bacterium]MCH8511398.1 hypothetical protein [Kiritimatiellia bacterium]
MKQIREQLSADWLDHDSPCDPWHLTSEELDDPGRRDAFVGSGWLGQRVGPWGDGDYPNGSGSYLAGFRRTGDRGRPGLRDLPRWAVLRLIRDTPRSLRPIGTVEDWRQTVDLRQATVETEYTWRGCEQGYHVRRETWVSRNQPLTGVLSAEVESFQGWNVEFDDELDAFHLGEDVHGHRILYEDGLMILEVLVGPARRILVMASRLWVEGETADQARILNRSDGRRAARRLIVPLRPGRRCRVFKVVGLATDADGEDPVAVACRRASADLETLRREHLQAWEAQWGHRIEVPHARLQRLLNASLYHLYAQLHEGHDHSIAPCGLSGHGWDGHVFWDADLWVHGALALLDPERARCIPAYRQKLLPGAKALAAAHGEAGARWPWMSADEGSEGCFDPEFSAERHINACVAMAQWRQLLAEGDEDGWFGPPGDCIIASAEWFAAAARREADGRWHFRGLCGADEHAKQVDDNAMTASAAAWTLRCAIRVMERRGLPPPPEWEAIASGLHIPYDASRRLVLQHADWKEGTVIKQADAQLMVWPYEHPFDDEEIANLVDYYGACYEPGVIMMARAIDSILYAHLGRADAAWEALGDLMPHFRGPYLINTESPANETSIFTTGLGGLLQVIVHGFAGVRYREKGLEFRPCLPPALPWIRLVGCRWLGEDLDIHVEGGNVRVERRNQRL